MAVVGDAFIVVRALTDKVDGDIRRGFNGVEGVGRKSGESLGAAFSRGFNKNAKSSNFMTQFSNGLRAILPDAEAVRQSFQKLVGRSYVLNTVIGQIVGMISALGGALMTLVGNAAGAASSIFALVNVFAAFGLAMMSAKIALGGVGKALSALNKTSGGGGGEAARAAAIQRVTEAERALAQVIEDNRNNLIDANNAVRKAQLDLNDAIKQGQEEIQQLGFDAEDAALSEQRAAIELEKARETLLRVQDLPPNSRARREAELAYAEAELGLRRAKDRSADLNAEQDRLAQTGVAGTDVVIRATEALAEAEQNKNDVILEGIRAQIRAEEALAQARAAANQSLGGGGTNPFEGLNAAQIEFVKNLQKLRPLLKTIKKNISEAFLPPLTDAINLIATKMFPTINAGMTKVAAATGAAAVDFAKMATSGENVAALGQLFTDSADLIGNFGTILGRIWGIFLSLLNAAAPVARKFVGWISNITAKFDNYLKSTRGKNEARDFFVKAGAAAADFGDIFGNLFSGFRAIINASLGPGSGGQYLLDWLKRATDGFANMGKTADGQDSLRKYFKDVAVNAQKVMSSIGALLSELKDLGANKAIGETFDILKQGAPALGDLIAKGAEAGPALAKLVVGLVEIANKLTDTGAMDVFFGTLQIFVDRLNALLENKLLMSIMTVTGQLFAMGAAFQMVQGVGKVAVKVAAGSFMGLENAIFGPSRAMGKLHTQFRAMSAFGGPFTKSIGNMGKSVTGLLKGPFGIALTVIGLLVTAFTVMYQTNDEFRATIDNLVASFMPLIQSVLPAVMGVLQPIIDGFVEFAKGALPGLMDVLGKVMSTLGPIFTTVLTQVGGFISQIAGPLMEAFQLIGTAVMDSLAPLMPVLAESFKQIADAAAPIIPMLVDAIVPAFTELIQAIAPLIPVLVQSLVPAFMSIVQAVLPVAAMLLTTLIPVIGLLIQQVVPLITTIIQQLVPAFTAIITALAPVIATIIQQLVPIIVMLIQTITPLITLIIQQLVPVFLAIVSAIVPIVTTIVSMLVPTITFLIKIFTGIIVVVIEVVKVILSILLPIITAVIKAFTGFITFLPKIGKAFSDVWNGIMGFFKGVANWIIGAIEWLVNGVISAINGFTKPLRDAIGAIAALAGKKVEIGIIPKVKLPRLAKGGIVAPTPGGTIAQIAEAGRAERVEPLDANGMSKRDKAIFDMMSNKQQQAMQPINITVNPSAGMDERALAMMVSEELTRTMRKGSIR